MKEWNPDLYRQFEAERTRPAKDLLARIPPMTVSHVTDLGCGPGNSTELLYQLWPEAHITGLDSSETMLEQAIKRLPQCHFMLADINTWQATPKQEIIYANASLQWLTHHDALFPHLISQLETGGVLAIQMPDNLDQPTHQLMQTVAMSERWHHKFAAGINARKRLLTTEQYYDLFVATGCSVDIWRTMYYHVMPSHLSMVDWLKSTGLRPFLAQLDEREQSEFIAQYHDALTEAYPSRPNGNVLMPFPRLFVVAQKQ